jgi:GNAT superfamily N-acetyltransferase
LSNYNLSISIRLARQHDVASMANVLVTCFYDPQPTYLFMPKWFRQLIIWSISFDLNVRLLDSSSRYACLISESDDKEAIATIEISLRDLHGKTGKYSCPYISNLAVHPEWRRRGVAAQLLRSSEQTSLKWGFRQIFLHVLENNQPALNLYRNLGYQLDKIDPELGSWIFNSPRRLLLKKSF